MENQEPEKDGKELEDLKKQLEEAEKKAREDALWEARTAAMNAYKAKREGREESAIAPNASVQPKVDEAVNNSIESEPARVPEPEPETVRVPEPEPVKAPEPEPVREPEPAPVKTEPDKPPVTESAKAPGDAPEDDEPHVEQRIGDKRYYIFDCPGCTKKVRVPNRGKKGRVAIVCPGCNTRFVKMRW